ncbi:SPT3 Dosage dependent suppressor of Ty-induced promoter mutations-like protein [Mortierella sp. 14UC]|nr:SPT3 Dosage dependent suppressor of Ty-induced promoter mutations-like protein [Mortierella sp. 14UC]
MPLLSPGTQMLQGMPPSRTSTSDAATMRAGVGLQQELNGYSIDARIIQKKDQMEDSSAGGGSNVVEEVRTGQQFLIKLQLTRQAGTPPASASAKYPTMRVDRREAINTAGEPRADAEPLTLQIIVHLARSGQIRKGACAKCCHKYGPSSPILVLLDPLSPSATDTFSYAHVDSSTGSVTVLAKVICSSTDHGERGNKDRYLFEFRLKRTSSMLSRKSADMREDEADTVATCFTAPIMCSGHHKAKRVYPSQRPAKVTKEGPVPKTKTIKRQRSVPSVTTNSGRQMSTDQNDEFLRSGSISSTSSYPSPLSFIHDNMTNSSMVSNFGDDQSNDFDTGSSSISSQRPLIGMCDVASEPQSQPPRIFEVRPDRGPIRKTIDVALRGLFFQEGMVPYFGCFPAQDIIVETSNLILCKAPESPLPGTVAITIYDTVGNSFVDLNQFTYTDDTETELLILQLQLRLAHRALEYLHTQATGRRGDVNDILKEIPGLGSSNMGDGSSSGGNMMSDLAPTDEESVILTREQVEDNLLTTLDQLPAGMDISFQLEDQGNLLHLSVLMGLDRLTLRLIEEGCELDALDAWAMTPLMYAVVKGNETIIRSLVIAGASSSGARTPTEFYSFLPRSVTPTAAVTGYLTVSCTRHSTTSRTLISSRSRGQPDMVEIENDEGSISSDSNSDAEDATTDSPQEGLPTIAEGQTVDNDDEQSVALLAERIRGVHVNHDMPPLDQQDLPPLHVMGSDGSITINNKVLKGDEIPRGVIPGGDTITTDNDESGYHSGVISEVQDRLRLLHEASLPSAGVEMTVAFNKLMSSSSSSAALSSVAENLFRTGDSFGIEIRLATVPIPDSIQTQPTLPKEFLGIRFPHEMVKRVGGRSTSILNEMTYLLETSIELGQSASPDQPHDHDHAGDGIDLKGSCNSCSKFLHEHRRLSPSRVSAENPSAYPILQFSVPAAHTEMILTAEGEAVGAQDASTFSTGVMELRNGQVEVRARVNCSSLHHLIQREKARRAAEVPTSSSSSSAPGGAVDLKDLEDPGYVFHFRLVHPTLHTVVARFSTGPILFQSFSRGRA